MTSRASRGRMSVGMFTYSTQPRGSVVHAAALADALADAGCDVTLYALDKDGRGFFRPLRANLVLIPAAPPPPTTAELVRLRAGEMAAHLERTRPAHDVFHAQDCLSANGLLASVARGVVPAMVRTVHHVERFADPELTACQARSIREAALCLTVSEAARREVAENFAIECPVVGNGVDVRRFQGVDAGRLTAWRERLGAGGPVVLSVGGVEARKNSQRILLAFTHLHRRFPRARLWILGGATVLDHGAARAEFDWLLNELPAEVRDAVVELGVVPEADVPALYHLADVLALPSLHEGFGLAALEALAAGLPVVASDRPPFTEFLDPSCATLVDPQSVDAIAAGVARALASGQVMRRVGWDRAQFHSWARVAARHLGHYERLATDAGDALCRSLA